MNKLYCCVLAILISIVGISQNNTSRKGNAYLSGTVTDSKNNGLSGATVSIIDLKKGLATDSTGHYSFKNLPTGKYLVEVKLVGFKSITQNINLTEGAHFTFKLVESYVDEGEVVVTGVSKATLIKRNPVPIVSVSHDYLVTNLATNAIDALVKIPGVRAVTTGPNVSKPFIRGLGYNRILTLYDGVRQEGQQWGDEHGIEVDQYSEEKVEIIKGPASLSYGSDALAGVVNIIPTQPAPEGKTVGDAVLDYQSNNKYIGGSVFMSQTKNGLEWQARISHKQAADYQNKYDGRVFGTAFNETDANASLGIHRNWGFSHLNVVIYNDLQEIPDGSRDSATHRFTRQISEADTVRQIVSDDDLKSYTIEKLHQHVQHFRVYWSNDLIVGDGNHLLVNLGYQNSIRREYSHPVLNDIPGLYLQLNTFNYDIKYSFKELNDWNITAGINGMNQHNKATDGTEFIVPNYQQFDIGPFATAKKSYGKLDVAGGVRFDVRSFKNDELYSKTNPATGFDMPVYGADTAGGTKVFSNYTKRFSGFSGSLGATYNFSSRFSVKANIGRGYRAPNIAEVSANGVHPGTNVYQMGNPDFKPEFSWQEDIGFLYSEKYVVASLDLFNNDIENYIYNQKLTNPDGSDLILVPGNQTFQFAAARAHLYGGECSVDIHPIKSLHFENSISLVYAENKGVAGKPVSDSAKYLPQISPTHGTTELRLDFTNKKLHITKGFIKAQLEFFGAQNRAYLAYNTETPTPGYTLLNAGVGGSITNKANKTLFSIYLMGNNLFDVAYQDHLSRLKYFYSYPNPKTGVDGIYNMGRNISLKLDVPFN